MIVAYRHQHHGAAGAAVRLPPAGRAGAARLHVRSRRSTISWRRHRIPIIVLDARRRHVAGLPLLYFLHFDFNPMNLRSAAVESVATYLDLRRDPADRGECHQSARALGSGADESAAAQGVAADRRRHDHRTFVPGDQEAKLALIAAAAKALDPVLRCPRARRRPTRRSWRRLKQRAERPDAGSRQSAAVPAQKPRNGSPPR